MSETGPPGAVPSGEESPVHVPPGGCRSSLDIDRASPRLDAERMSPGSEFTAVSPQPSQSASAGLDQWEALDFSQPVRPSAPLALHAIDKSWGLHAASDQCHPKACGPNIEADQAGACAPQISFEAPQALLRELSVAEPGAVAARFVELQSRLGTALQAPPGLRLLPPAAHLTPSSASLAAATAEQPH